jgi:hypothetical protein
MHRFRLALRLAIFFLATFLFAWFLWFLAIPVEVFVFGGGTPECTDSDTCSAFGDVVYSVPDHWLAQVCWFLLSGLLLWLLLFRRFLPIRGQVTTE